jgi:hypothetical protein
MAALRREGVRYISTNGNQLASCEVGDMYRRTARHNTTQHNARECSTNQELSYQSGLVFLSHIWRIASKRGVKLLIKLNDLGKLLWLEMEIPTKRPTIIIPATTVPHPHPPSSPCPRMRPSVRGLRCLGGRMLSATRRHAE